MSKVALLLILSLLVHSTFAAQTLTQFHKRSGVQQPLVVELFTSQGCSSCPPMERWLSGFKQETGLWHYYFPLAFHVTYWNYLGWKDPFAKRAFSQRQYDYLNHKGISQVYTPQLVINGREWRPGGRTLLPDESDKRAIVGRLSLTITGQEFSASFDSRLPSNQGLILHLALLGSGLTTRVGRGENRGKHLVEDFVVLSHRRYSALARQPLNDQVLLEQVSVEQASVEQGSAGQALVGQALTGKSWDKQTVTFSGSIEPLPKADNAPKRLAWVAWIEKEHIPLQAVGDWLLVEEAD